MINKITLKSNYDVVIVGNGPVGATLANLLGKCGIDTLIIDREEGSYSLPRAVHFDDEVMRVFQTIDLGSEVAATLRVNPGMRFVDNAGKLLLDWPRPQEISSQGWHSSYRFHQPDLEKILRDGLKRYSSIEFKNLCEATDVNDLGDQVSVELKDRANGSTQTIFARYVVGCDGANSLVRRTIDDAMEDLGFSERWLVVDVLLNKDKPSLGDHSIQYCNPERSATYVRSPRNRRRWEFKVLDEETNEYITNHTQVWKLLENWLTEEEAEIERSAVYTFKSKIVKQWRKGRLMVAGDAAHVTPPFMGQGMCAGIRDVSNLGWKLAVCVQKGHDDLLLNSYAKERHPHVKAYIGTAVRLGGLINACATEEALQAAFKRDDGSTQMKSISPHLGSCLAAGNKEQSGRLFAQPQLRSGKYVDDQIGYACALFIDPLRFEIDLASLDIDVNNLRVITPDQAPDVIKYLDQLGTGAVLTRADRYIFGTANNVYELRDLLLGAPESPLQGG